MARESLLVPGKRPFGDTRATAPRTCPDKVFRPGSAPKTDGAVAKTNATNVIIRGLNLFDDLEMCPTKYDIKLRSECCVFYLYCLARTADAHGCDARFSRLTHFTSHFYES